jgi:hypothetical protein
VDRFAAVPRPFDLAALFFAPFFPPLRAPLYFLIPYLAAISFAPFFGLCLAHRSKIIKDCHHVLIENFNALEIRTFVDTHRRFS